MGSSHPCLAPEEDDVRARDDPRGPGVVVRAVVPVEVRPAHDDRQHAAAVLQDDEALAGRRGLGPRHEAAVDARGLEAGHERVARAVAADDAGHRDVQRATPELRACDSLIQTLASTADLRVATSHDRLPAHGQPRAHGQRRVEVRRADDEDALPFQALDQPAPQRQHNEPHHRALWQRPPLTRAAS